LVKKLVGLEVPNCFQQPLLVLQSSRQAASKAGAVFVDLTAAYDTVWHPDLTCNSLLLLPHRHMVRVILELVGNRSLTLTIGNNKQVTTSQEWRPAGIRFSILSLQHLHLWLTNHRLQKVCIRRRSSNHTC